MKRIAVVGLLVTSAAGLTSCSAEMTSTQIACEEGLDVLGLFYEGDFERAYARSESVRLAARVADDLDVRIAGAALSIVLDDQDFAGVVRVGPELYEVCGY